MKYSIAALIFVLSLAASGSAQETRTITPAISGNARAAAEIIAAGSTKTVKGAPFSAEAISESVQTLADGNRITRTVTHKLYRDGEGRFRREETSNAGANTAAGLLGSYQTSIFDPVAGVRYMLNPTAKTAQRFAVPNKSVEGAVIVNGRATSEAKRVQVEALAAGKSSIVVLPGFAAAFNGDGGKTESLGVRDFEGVQAEGSRTVTTIAAGAIGNELPIEIVYERWFSKDLDMIVYSKHTNPLFGEQTYRMTNINRSEPDRSLFTPPADYKVLKVLAEQTIFTTRKQ